MSREDLLARRRRLLGPSLSLSYDEPLEIVRGEGAYLFDPDGRSYLDLVNNVCHVGHCHPRVVAAAVQQMRLLNTNTRYLHENVLRYAERLTAKLPASLQVAYFVCSGSEANDLALRIARTATGAHDVLVLGDAYHGSLGALVELSPYKYAGRGGAGRPEHVLEVPRPDAYRGVHRGPHAGARYAAEVERGLASHPRPLAAFFAESLLGCGGQVEPPPGFLSAASEHARRAGGVYVADEVQVGFGRVGSHFWGFERHDVLPDVVTLGKPIGNGHPLAAVVTTRELADAFANGMEYFNTFGGNPVSAAVGLAVLDVIEEEDLQRRAAERGDELLAGLRDIASSHSLVGDVRGAGLFLGVELVLDRDERTPAPAAAKAVCERLKQRGILLSTDGPDANVLKLKPPLVVSPADVARFLEELEAALALVQSRMRP